VKAMYYGEKNKIIQLFLEGHHCKKKLHFYNINSRASWPQNKMTSYFRYLVYSFPTGL